MVVTMDNSGYEDPDAIIGGATATFTKSVALRLDH